MDCSDYSDCWAEVRWVCPDRLDCSDSGSRDRLAHWDSYSVRDCWDSMDFDSLAIAPDWAGRFAAAAVLQVLQSPVHRLKIRQRSRTMQAFDNFSL
jgi:hypothetical protein